MVILREDVDQKVDDITFEQGEVYCVDVAFSSGEGKFTYVCGGGSTVRTFLLLFCGVFELFQYSCFFESFQVCLFQSNVPRFFLAPQCLFVFMALNARMSIYSLLLVSKSDFLTGLIVIGTLW